VANMNKMLRRVLLALFLGSILTALTYAFVVEKDDPGPSCSGCQDLASGYVRRGLPFGYYEQTIPFDTTAEKTVDIHPTAVVADVIIWSLPMFALLTIDAKSMKRRAQK